MPNEECFERIPFESPYDVTKKLFGKRADEIVKTSPGWGPSKGAQGCLALYYEEATVENGMKGFVVVLLAFLYVMEHNDVDPELQGAAEWYIEMFEEGDYEDLFEEEDLRMLKKDIRIIKEYIKEHPLEDE